MKRLPPLTLSPIKSGKTDRCPPDRAVLLRDYSKPLFVHASIYLSIRSRDLNNYRTSAIPATRVTRRLEKGEFMSTAPELPAHDVLGPKALRLLIEDRGPGRFVTMLSPGGQRGFTRGNPGWIKIKREMFILG